MFIVAFNFLSLIFLPALLMAAGDGKGFRADGGSALC